MQLADRDVAVLSAMGHGEYYALRHWGKKIINQQTVFPKNAPLGIKQCADMEDAGLICFGSRKVYKSGEEIPLLITESGKHFIAKPEATP